MAREIPFTPEQLTGRSRDHVIELADPPCTLHRDVVGAFQALRADARRAGIDLVPVSSFRDFSRQLAIWNAKHGAERDLRGADGRLLDAAALDDDARVTAVLHWSALPGASRHHWGTDFDAIDAAALPAGYRPQLVPEEYAPGGVFAALNDWLDAHAARHGFYRPYGSWRGGVQPEPWHLSHAVVAGEAQRQFTEEVLRGAVESGELAARGAVVRRLPEIVARYVLNVDTPPAGSLIPATRPA